MTVTATQFRLDFPEFADKAAFPDSAYNFWYGVAQNFVGAAVWRNIQNVGLELYVAHQLTLEARAKGDAANGLPPGGQVGPLNSQSVDKASAGFDTQAGIEPEAGHWNLTIYGTRFIRLVKMVGMGCVQLGAGCGAIDPLSSGNAWTGPDCNPSPTSFSS